MALTFLNETPIYNHSQETIRIVGIASSGHVICRVAKRALLAYEAIDDASAIELLQIFDRHRHQVEHTARERYLTGLQQDDGSIFISPN
jgi:hypothetical protein